MSEGTRVLAGLGVGLGAGLAIAASNNPALLKVADFVAPVGTLWINAIRMTVIPLVVSLVISGVASASTVGTVGRIGRRTILVFIAMLTGATESAALSSAGLFEAAIARPAPRPTPRPTRTRVPSLIASPIAASPRASHHQVAAIDVQRSAGDVTGALGRGETNQV